MSFDPDTFLNIEVDQPMETKYTPVPEDTYQAFIEEIIVRDAKGTPVLDVVWDIPSEELRENLGLEKVLVRQSIFIDIDDDGRILFGPNQNVRLGNLRAALNQNKKGKWSFRSLIGAGPCMIKVSIKPDKDDPEVKWNRVDRVTAA